MLFIFCYDIYIFIFYLYFNPWYGHILVYSAVDKKTNPCAAPSVCGLVQALAVSEIECCLLLSDCLSNSQGGHTCPVGIITIIIIILINTTVLDVSRKH